MFGISSVMLIKYRKYILYAVAVLAVLWLFRLYINKVYSDGKQAGRVEMSKEILEEKQAEWEAREREIHETRQRLQEEINSQRQELDARMTELNQQRRATRTALNQFVENLNTERDRDNANVYSIPASELDDAIRNLSNQLATAEREGEETGSAPVD